MTDKKTNPKDDTKNCLLNGFERWQCSSSVGPNQAMPVSDGYYNIVCNKFMPIYKPDMVGTDLKDYRFAPPTLTNKIYTPLTLWLYDSDDGTPYELIALDNFSGASGLFAGACSVAIALYTLF